MHQLDGRIIYSATDLNNYVECRHLVNLSREVAAGMVARPDVVDETAELVKRKGDEHERKRLAQYEAAFGTGVVRLDERAVNTFDGLYAAEARTVAAMASGAQIIYQATFFDGEFVGHTDFLRRVERASAHWAWSYEVIDTKLALSPKPYFLIQLCNYSEHLERVQGVAPANGYVVFGNGEERAFRISAYDAYYRHLTGSFLSAAEARIDVYPAEVAHCNVCSWSERCEQRREDDDYLGLVAGIRTEQIAKLADAGITTMTALAHSTHRPHRMSETTYTDLRTQAALQLGQRLATAAGDPYPYAYKFRDPKPEDPNDTTPETSGFAKLPPPAAGDIFFDIEGDPLYRADRGLEYLFGLYVPDEDRYIAYWANNADEERAAFEACVDFIAERLERYPGLHVYHYASYERSALGRLMGTFASREKEIDAFFTIGLFVDLYTVVRQAIWVSQPSYSLKQIEKLFGWKRTTQTKGGDDSIVMFESWLATGEQHILDDIERYNEDDCRSTHALLVWLLALRAEYNATLPEPIPWRVAKMAEPPAEAPERTELEARLLEGIKAPTSLEGLAALPVAERERWIVGNVLQYHRRENKPAYWEYFYRCEHLEELVEFDRKAIGGLRRCMEVEPVKRIRKRHFDYVFTYPEQEHDLRGGAHCSILKKPVSEIVAHDEIERRITLQLSDEMARTIRALIPGAPLPHKSRQAGIERIATALLEGTLEAEHPATSALLRGSDPRLSGYTPGSRIQPERVDAASLSHAIASLDRSYLFVQGPPGSGKSTLGAAAIVDLLRAGKRVALMANGHKPIHGLLKKIETTAHAAGFRFDGAHKMSDFTDDSEYSSDLAAPMIRSFTKTDDLLGAQLVSGTAFFWPDERLTGALDTIVIDEAGQVSIADALNASMAARNVVLLGDPRQLPQVTQSAHPVGAALSILEHLLGDHDTIPPERGIFLNVSYRMEPSIASFVSKTSYDGRLEAAPQTRENCIESPGLSGGGLAYLPVTHSGNGGSSIEEAERIAYEISLLLRGTFRRNGKPSQTLTGSDILVVTPYNLQRRRISDALADAGIVGVKIGTVDKFQGQEAPVVFYSMATSSNEDVPRGMNFLFDRNRFNVAISRAQCLSVLVCSPKLLDARCRNDEQMMLVSLLCSFAEHTVAAWEQRLHIDPEVAVPM